MNDVLYVMLLEKTKTYNRLNKAAVIRHVDNIRKLDDDGNMELCGVLRGYPGTAGMVILKADKVHPLIDEKLIEMINQGTKKK